MAIWKAAQILICMKLGLYDLGFVGCMIRFSENSIGGGARCLKNGNSRFGNSFLLEVQDLGDAQRDLLILDMVREALKHLEFFMLRILMRWGSRNPSYKIFQHLYCH